MKNIIRSSLAIILAAAGNIAANGEEPEFIKITPWAEASLSDMSAPAAGDPDRKAKSSPRATDASHLTKTYVEFDNVFRSDAPMHGASSLTLKGYDSGKVTIENFFIHGSRTLEGSLSGSTLTIPAQTLLSVSGKEVIFCRFVPEENKYVADGAVTAQVADDGTVNIGPWCGVILSESGASLISNGFSSSICTSTELRPTNAEMRNVSAADGSVEEYGIYIEQKYPNSVTIYNFIDNGVGVDAYVNADKSIEIAPQPLFTNMQYGTFLCYPADWSKVQRLKGNICGTSDSTGMEFGNWGLFSQSYSQVYSAAYASSSITFGQGVGLAYPEPMELRWTGTGSESDPFMIATPYDMCAFSESVADGESYENMYVALANDIDATGFPTVFRPIGRSESHPFNGHFSGNGHAVDKLSINAGSTGNAGLFGYLGSRGSISDLTLTSPSITSYGAKTGSVVGEAYGLLEKLTVTDAVFVHYGIYGGGIVGYGYENVVDGCSFKGSMIVGGASGGIAGIVYNSEIRNCSVDADIVFPRQTNALYRAVGGVAGYIISTTNGESEVEDCLYTGTLRDVEGKAHVGGLIGDINGGTLRRSMNLGALSSAVSAQNGTFGGLVGLMNSGTISDCYAANQMVASSDGVRVGGLVGCIFDPVLASGRASVIENCYYSGQLVRPSATGTQPVFGSCEPDVETTFRNVYFDRQINPYDIDPAIAGMALNTSAMTKSTGLKGFDKTVWSFAKGSYPVLRKLADKPASVLSAAPVTFDKNQSLIKVKSDFTVSCKDGVDWFVYTEDGLSKESDALSIDGETVGVKPVSSRQTIMGTLGSLWKCYNLTTVNASGFAGEGTIDNPYLISTKEDLVELDKNVSRYGIVFTDEYFLQTNDIDLNYSPDFSGIGTAATTATAFNGVYDGGGHAIHRMEIDGVAFGPDGMATASGSRPAAAFITYADKRSVIKNLTIAPDCRIRGYSNVAGIVAATRGRVENCRNHADITAVDCYAAGITAQITQDASISGCYNSGTITAGTNNSAGIVCLSDGLVDMCQNDGEVRAVKLPESSLGDQAQHTAAGIACTVYDNSVVRSNINTGYVHSRRDVGGIFQSASKESKITGNMNYGTVFYTHTDGTCGSISATQTKLPGASDNIYDRQITRYGAACLQPAAYANGVTTAEFISGEPLAGPDEEAVDWKKGSYPVLKAFAEEPAAIANRQIIVNMHDTETADIFKTSASLAPAAIWTVSGDNAFKITEGRLSFDRPEDFMKSAYATLTATVGDYSKPVFIRALPLNFNGSGTESDPFLIHNTDDLVLLSDITNDEMFDFNGMYLRQTADIDFAGKGDFLPVAARALPFNGVYDGGGKKITNLTIIQPDMDYAALFREIGEKGSISDLTLEKGSITAYRYAGGFVGRLGGKAEHLVFAGNVTTSKGYPYAGGIAGIAVEGSVISECSNKGNVSPEGGHAAGIVYAVRTGAVVEKCTNDSPIGCSPAGGIAVVSAGRISDCANNAEMTGTGSIGGILVSNAGGDIVERCVNNAAIRSSGTGVGGIIGLSSPEEASHMTDCHNYAEIQGGSAVGGLVGYATRGINIEKSCNEAPVSAYYQYAGGLVGYVNGTFSDTDVFISECCNRGLVKANEYAGGIGGYIGIHSNVCGSCNVADVISDGRNAGGIAAEGRNIDIIGCWNAGTIRAGGEYAAGIIGKTTSGEIRQTANFGDVISECVRHSNCNAAGLVAESSATIISSYNTGKVSAPTCASGLVGHIDAVNVSMSDSYNAGTIECEDKAAAVVLSTRFEDPSMEGIRYLDTAFHGTPSDLDSKASPVTSDELMTAGSMGEGFAYRENAWPVAEPLSENGIANFHAAWFSLTEGDTRQSVTEAISIASLPEMEWEASEQFHISDCKILPSELGEGWIRKKTSAYGLDLSEEFILTVTKATYGGTEPFASDGDIISTHWYGPDGIEVLSPEPGKMYIRVDIRENGSMKSSRTICGSLD